MSIHPHITASNDDDLHLVYSSKSEKHLYRKTLLEYKVKSMWSVFFCV